MRSAAQFRIEQPVADEDRAFYPAHFAQGLVQPVLSRRRCQLLEDDGRRHQTCSDRSLQPQDLIPVVLDDIHVDGSSDQRVERFVSRIAINDKEPAIAEIADTGNEPVAKGVEHGERRFGGASGIGCVLIDFDGAFVVKEAVENVGASPSDAWIMREKKEAKRLDRKP